MAGRSCFEQTFIIMRPISKILKFQMLQAFTNDVMDDPKRFSILVNNRDALHMHKSVMPITALADLMQNLSIKMFQVIVYYWC